MCNVTFFPTTKDLSHVTRSEVGFDARIFDMWWRHAARKCENRCKCDRTMRPTNPNSFVDKRWRTNPDGRAQTDSESNRAQKTTERNVGFAEKFIRGNGGGVAVSEQMSKS